VAIMSNDKTIIANFDALFRNTLLFQANSVKQLNECNNLLASSEVFDSNTLIHAHQLILQFRLDTQNIINSLLSLNQALAQALGIEVQNDFATNLERAAFALGKEALIQELSILSHLTEQLKNVLALSEKARKEQEKELKELKKLLSKLKKGGFNREIAYTEDSPTKEHSSNQEIGEKHSKKTSKLERRLLTAIDLQVNFNHSVTQLTESLQVFGNIPQFGIIYDYLAGLKGPVSRFQQSLENGLGLSQNIINQLQTKLGLEARKTKPQQLIQQFNQQLTSTMATQKQLLQQSHNNIKQVKELATTLNQQNKVQQSRQNQFEQDHVARRMLNLFNRQ
jgi:hypothetical protein